MARNHARVYASIWADEDFRALEAGPQRMFLFLLSQPDLEHSGIIALRERRWSRSAADLTVADVAADLERLAEARFVVIDEDTEELLVRSLMRWDGVWKQPNVAKAAAAQIRTVASAPLREALCGELERLAGDDLHREAEAIRIRPAPYRAHGGDRMTFTFYLGAHQPHWLATAGFPLFVSHSRLRGRKTLPPATCRWALDSGGFTQLKLRGGWEEPASSYAAAVRRYSDEIGQMDFAAPQDWMCEPWIIKRTGLSVTEHQRRTVANYLELRMIAADLPFIPVLQGWARDDYLRHAGMYLKAGIDLAAEPRVGLGSVCRRQGTGEADLIAQSLASIRLHGFGFKTTGLVRFGQHRFLSADSMAWSYDARRSPRLPGCRGHRNCANCIIFATRWRRNLLDSLAAADARGWQGSLFDAGDEAA